MAIVDLTEAPVKRKAVLLFWTLWNDASKPGGPMDRVLDALSASSPSEILFGRINAEECVHLTDMYGVSAVPTFILLNEVGQMVEKIEGENAAFVTQSVQVLIHDSNPSTNDGTSGTLSSANPPSVVEQLQRRLDRLIRTSEVMLFMKGIPDAPRCGFSRQIVELLEEESIAFCSFDILTDNAVRQGLKTFSNWPTYPQLYVNGAFIGGLDILKEMKEEGSLRSQLGLSSFFPSSNEKLSPEAVTLEDRLAQLTSKEPIMLFMKGLPSAPKCGFSRQIVEMLEEEEVPFGAFDILQDEEVRQGLKKFSNWPTYPQLYVNGVLIGGLDIVKELKDDGSLNETLRVT